MKLPRDLSGAELAKKLKALGYTITRKTGSHIRLTSELNGQHHITVPEHDPLKVGTLSSILGDIAAHHKLSKDQVVQKIS